jgi:hypothetical protein
LVKTYDRDRVMEHVSRVANDQELRDHARAAIDSIMAVYAKVQADGPKKAVADKDVASDVLAAASELRETARHMAEPQRQRGSFLKVLLLLAIAAVAVLGARRLLESDEDEFEYRP